MKRLSLLLLALAAAFALHAQGVKDPDNNKASRGQTLYFYGEPDYYQWQQWGWGDYYNWNDESCWFIDSDHEEPVGRIPTAADDVIILPGSTCMMPEGGYAFASLTIEDGACLYAPQFAENFVATVKKNIQAYEEDENDGWYLLSFPTDVEKTDTIADGPDFIGAGMITMNRNFDLFYFDQSFPGDPEGDETAGEWRNFKYYVAHDMPFKAPIYYFEDEDPMNTNAYLYANEEETTLSFTGTLWTDQYYRYKVLPINDEADEAAQGVHLLGNPYTCNAYIDSDDYYDDDFVSGYFYLNEYRNDVEIYYGEDYSYTLLAPMTAFFVKVTEEFNDDDWDDKEIRLEPWHPSQHGGEDYNILRSTSKGSTMSIELTSNGVRHDRVILNGKGKECTKFSMSSRTPKIFVPQGNKKYAMASTVGANVMPLCFTTQQSGIYTLNFDKKHMDCSYLHLIDNATGADIDLLSTPSYTFNSEDANYATRFKLVFSEDATNEIADNFAYISNGELMINNSGNATLQVMDLTGRILSTENIQDSYSMSLNLSAGVYVVRLSNGSDVKTQKIVVK